MSLPALPHLTSFDSVTSFSETVLPYLHQAKDHTLALYNRDVTFYEFYRNTNPAITALIAAHVLSVFVFVTGEVSGDYSQVDRLWSILPAAYIAHFTYYAHLEGLPTQRLDTLAAFAALWSIRLTYNFYRKGGYARGGEDYRWPILRSKMSRFTQFLFNLFFVSWYQNLLLLSVATPAYLLLLVSTLKPDILPSNENLHAFGTSDLIFSRALVLALITEGFADHQQWKYQNAKKQWKETGVVPEGWVESDLERGFCVVGLWSFSRHPNFLAEQAIWVLIYQWGCFTTNTVYNWTAIGAFMYCALFQGSTWFTEKISAEKYPEYREYQRLVNRFVPKLGAFFERESAPSNEKKEQ